MTVGVIIPALNEADAIASSIASAFDAGAFEVVVGDGGSTDATAANAARAGARVVSSSRGRARQMNAAAERCACDILLFLHADTMLPPEACTLVSQAVADGHGFGGFEISFRESDWRLRAAERLINLRTRITREPWGDQAQFVDRALFESGGGFADLPILEDYELARRMRSRTEAIILPSRVATSGRRFLAKGVVATVATNWRIIVAYEMGERPEVLAATYR